MGIRTSWMHLVKRKPYESGLVFHCARLARSPSVRVRNAHCLIHHQESQREAINIVVGTLTSWKHLVEETVRVRVVFPRRTTSSFTFCKGRNAHCLIHHQESQWEAISVETFTSCMHLVKRIP